VSPGGRRVNTRNRTSSGLLAASLLTSVVAYAVTRSPRLEAAERRLSLRMRRQLGETADVVVSATTDLGSTFGVAGTATALAATGHRREAGDVVGAGAAGWIVAQSLKMLVDRARPYEADGAARLVSIPAGSSWPSGHPAVAAAMATVLAPRLGTAPAVAAGGAAVYVAWSRIYVGVHHPTDVIAGLGLGIACGVAWLELRERVERALAGDAHPA
jgi:membrane-associated phospholipid phosphatase